MAIFSVVAGWRTYITAVAAGLVLCLQQLGILTEDQGKALMEGLGVLLVVFLRLGVADLKTTITQATTVKAK